MTPRSRPRQPRPPAKQAADQPGNSWKYLYQRLSEKQFQQLCGALLRNTYPGTRCYPVGMSDGGRDIVVREGDDALIYQVKWTSKLENDPASWLRAAIEGERANITRLIEEEGATKYFLMTSVSGTAVPSVGSMDTLDEELAKFSKEFGIAVECLWQSDVDSMVDLAPDSVKWVYHEMLAGGELIRYLIHGDQIQGRAAEMRTTLLTVMAAQWGEDCKVRFSQAEMDTLNIVDLFIDVEEELEARPTNVAAATLADRQTRGKGAVGYLLTSSQPLTLVRGEPGQGKSTLGQYLCQVHRAAIMPVDATIHGRAPDEVPQDPRLPFRADLRDYATWLEGRDPYAAGDPVLGRPAPRTKKSASLDSFLAHACSHYSGGREVTVEQVQDLLHRYPLLVVLDGLDEVADPGVRKRVVEEIDALSLRLGSSSLRRFQLVVTTRPNSTGLAEPSADRFETIRLRPLSSQLQERYLRKWAAVNGLRGQKLGDLFRVFKSRSAEDHIAQLADNPMQLTILLYLMNRRGDSVPEARTPLYNSYMETLLDREVQKGQIHPSQRSQAEEATSYLGWRIQAGVEDDGTRSRMTVIQIERALMIYLHAREEPVDGVQTLFRAVSDRFWAMTSKVQGTFEFAVQPVREYFAARFLAEYAGMTGSVLMKSQVLRELSLRSYWLNTARFYAGFASPNELSSLVDGLAEAVEEGRHPLQTRVTLWSLLADGAFSAVTRAQKNAAALLADDLGVRLLASRSTTADTFSGLAADRGGQDLCQRLRENIQNGPDQLLRERVGLLHRLGLDREQFETWWRPLMAEAAGTSDEDKWLEVGAAYSGRRARLGPDLVQQLTLGTHTANARALAVGANPDVSSPQFPKLTQAVLDGHCTDIPAPGRSPAGDLLRAARPQHFLALAKDTGAPVYVLPVGHHHESPAENRARPAAFHRLIASDDRYRRLQRANAYRVGQKGTTAPWQNTARELAAIHGPCWLAADIAVTGIAVRGKQTGGDISRDGAPLGPEVDYGTFVGQARAHLDDVSWWRTLHHEHSDPLSRSTWALALIAAASESVVVETRELLDDTLASMEGEHFGSLAATSSRLGASGIARRLPQTPATTGVALGPRTHLLASHHTASLATLDPLAMYTTDQLTDLNHHGPASWPALRALTCRMMESPSDELLDALRASGPEAVVHIPPTAPHPGAAYVEDILQRPADYPAAWVHAAERWHSQTATEPSLARIAIDNRWTPDLSS